MKEPLARKPHDNLSFGKQANKILLHCYGMCVCLFGTVRMRWNFLPSMSTDFSVVKNCY